MTREEQIREAALAYSFDTDGGCTGDLNIGRDDFMNGAEWADAHPANPWHKYIREQFPNLKSKDKYNKEPFLVSDGKDCWIDWFNPMNGWVSMGDVKFWMEIPKLPSE